MQGACAGSRDYLAAAAFTHDIGFRCGTGTPSPCRLLRLPFFDPVAFAQMRAFSGPVWNASTHSVASSSLSWPESFSR